MDFEVNGQAYVFTFLPKEGSFALFEKDGEDFERIKIVHDDGPLLVATVGNETERTPSLN